MSAWTVEQWGRIREHIGGDDYAFYYACQCRDALIESNRARRRWKADLIAAKARIAELELDLRRWEAANKVWGPLKITPSAPMTPEERSWVDSIFRKMGHMP